MRNLSGQSVFLIFKYRWFWFDRLRAARSYISYF
jgi:hypothetical protein